MHTHYASHPYRNSVHMTSYTSTSATEWCTIPLPPSSSASAGLHPSNFSPMHIPTEPIRTVTLTASSTANALRLIRHKLSLPFKKKGSSRPTTPTPSVPILPQTALDSSSEPIIDIRCDKPGTASLSSASRSDVRPSAELPAQWKDQIFDLVAEALISRPEPAHPHPHNGGHSSGSISRAQCTNKHSIPYGYPHCRNPHYRSLFPEMEDVINFQENFLDLSSPPIPSTVSSPPIVPPAPTRQRARSSSMRARGPLLPLSVNQQFPTKSPSAQVQPLSTSDSLGLGISNLTSPPLPTSTTSSPILPYHDPQSPILIAPALPEGRGLVPSQNVDISTRAKATLSLDLSSALDDGISLVELEGMLEQLQNLSGEMRAARARKVARAIMTGESIQPLHDPTSSELRLVKEDTGSDRAEFNAKAMKNGRKIGKRVTSGKENAPVGSKIPVRRSIWGSMRSPKLRSNEVVGMSAMLSPNLVTLPSPRMLSPPVCRIVVTPPAEEGLHEWEWDMVDRAASNLR